VKFAFPEYWIWMLGIPVSLGIMYLVYKRVSQIIFTWFSKDQYERSFPLLKFGLRALAFVLLFMALLGPYQSTSEEQVNIMGREIYLLLDVSASMNATDIQPTRLERAKLELQKLVDQLKGDKLGLILFTENPYVQCPLTQDHEAVKLFIQMAETEQFTQTGTQFRNALALALDRFNHIEMESQQISRAVVIISDGEDHGDSYASLIERMKRQGIKVFTVGIGTDEGAPIPVSIQSSNPSYKRQEDGEVVISRLEDDALREIGKAFGTEYLRIDQDMVSTEKLEGQIYDITASALETSIEQVKNNQFQVFIFISVVLLVASMFIMPIRKV